VSESDRDDDEAAPRGARTALADAELEALVAKAMRRKTVVPTTEAEVRRAEEEGVDFEGELPPSLRALVEPRAGLERGAGRVTEPGRRSDERDVEREPARSVRVVSLDEARRARERRASFGGYAASFALGAAAAAAVAVFALRGPGDPEVGREPAGGPSASASSSAEPVRPAVVIPAVLACPSSCCAGSSCPSAEGELRACATGRSCVPCGDVPPAGSAYRVRIGNLLPTNKLDADKLGAFDICARIGGSPWSCEPAYAEASERPRGRVLPPVASVEDIGAGIELELRPRGTLQVFGRYKGSVRLNPTVLCRGVGVLLGNEKEEHLGSLSLFVEDAQYVELGRGSVAELTTLRSELAFADVTPELHALAGSPGSPGSPGTQALTVGPLDLRAAERLRVALLERGRAATSSTGADYAERIGPLP
jgi:hypothetical protein